MERRLSAALAVTMQPTIILRSGSDYSAQAPEPLPAEANEAIGVLPSAAAVDSGHGSLFGDDVPWPTDDVGESAFLADARARGESVARVPAVPREEAVEDKSPLPPLEELVARIPTETREALEELFRVKFTTVRRVPAKDLKP